MTPGRGGGARRATGALRRASDQPARRREISQLNPVRDAEAFAQLAQMVIDVVRAGVEPSADLLVGGAFGDADEQFALERREALGRALARRRDQLRRGEAVHRQAERQHLLERRRRDPVARAARRGEARERVHARARHGHRIHHAAAHVVVVHHAQETVERVAAARRVLARELPQVPDDGHARCARAEHARIDVVMAAAHVIAAIRGRRERFVQIQAFGVVARELEGEIGERREAHQPQQACRDAAAFGGAARAREHFRHAQARREARIGVGRASRMAAPDDVDRLRVARRAARIRARRGPRARRDGGVFLHCNVRHDEKPRGGGPAPFDRTDGRGVRSQRARS
ncbi:hypothetical protein BURPS1710b_A2241 [Burkholderia pseudomallei 1710b]|uniref:Uncharacterized protein n=1 Tax=Burkholderia pseudomallei (strain 1710b) TaxID=320372 RepID=Q3JGB2_BURP1|nr:hypothetical protein BURPS1710b_A2241 [Burkholderia pseudomallei 1710b]